MVGLAFSGGGIRSATFNLGILQALAGNLDLKHEGDRIDGKDYLRRVDYLSTVSGGGYIGSWLVSWMRRVGSKPVATRLKENRQDPPDREPWRRLEPDQIRFLRRYSSYLAPRSGLLSADTWTMVTIYLRNLILNLSLLIVVGAGVLLVPDLALWGMRAPAPPVAPLWSVLGLAALAAAVAVGIGFGGVSDAPAPKGLRRHILRHVGLYSSASTFVSAVVATLLLLSDLSTRNQATYLPKWFVIVGAAAYTAFWVIALQVRRFSKQGVPPSPVETGVWGGVYRYGATLVAGALQGYLLYWMAQWFAGLGLKVGEFQGSVIELVFGPPLLVATLLITTVFHMGLCGRATPDADREWAARAAAVLTLVTLGWIALFGATLYGPLIIKWLTASHWAQETWGKIFKSLLGVAWAAISAGGALAGKSAQTNGKSGSLTWLTKTAPPVFVVGLILLLSYGVDCALPHLPDWHSQKAGTVKTCAPDEPCDQAKDALDRVTVAARQLLSAASLQQMAGAAGVLDKALGAQGQDFHQLSQKHWQNVQDYTGSRLVICLLICIFLSVLLWWRVDVNEFSMHLFYRNRLTRAYLGASQTDRESQTDPFTGFSLNDDLRLHWLTTQVPRWREPVDRSAVPERMSPHWEELLAQGVPPERDARDAVSILPYDGPYPIFCTTLNLVRGKELAWQQRMAASFIYTPLYCGYDYFKYTAKGTVPSTRKFALSAYRETRNFSREEDPKPDPTVKLLSRFRKPKPGSDQPIPALTIDIKDDRAREGGPKVGTAVAISGAAASPNMGYHTSPALGFLMAVFNVRLGWWAGNPRHPWTWKKFGPRWGLLYLLRELFPDTSDSMAYVYLSDGGHFENLGIYELVRRKCRFIVCCDVGHDPEGQFEDLGNAVERCRSDFGVDIDISVDDLKPDPKTRLSKAHFKLGTIRYPAIPGQAQESEGTLLYIKSTLTGDEPADVTAYAAANTVFPNNSTGNQFFDESLFESYRALGQHIFGQIVKAGLEPPVLGADPQAPESLARLCENLKRVADEAVKD